MTGLGFCGNGADAGGRPPSLHLVAFSWEDSAPCPLPLEHSPERLTHLLLQPLLSSTEGQHQSDKPGRPLLPGSRTGSLRSYSLHPTSPSTPTSDPGHVTHPSCYQGYCASSMSDSRRLPATTRTQCVTLGRGLAFLTCFLLSKCETST